MKLKEKNNILMNLANHTEKSVLMPENPVTLDNPDGIYLYRGRKCSNRKYQDSKEIKSHVLMEESL